MSAPDRRRLPTAPEIVCPCCATKSPAKKLRCTACGQILPRRKPPAASGARTRGIHPADERGAGASTARPVEREVESFVGQATPSPVAPDPETDPDSRVRRWDKLDGGFVIEVEADLRPGFNIEFESETSEETEPPRSVDETASSALDASRPAPDPDEDLPETRTYFGAEPAPRVEEEEEEELDETRTYAAAEAAAKDVEPEPEPAEQPSVLERWVRPTRSGDDEEDEEVEQVSGMFGITAGSPQAKHFCESTKRGY